MTGEEGKEGGKRNIKREEMRGREDKRKCCRKERKRCGKEVREVGKGRKRGREGRRDGVR